VQWRRLSGWAGLAQGHKAVNTKGEAIGEVSHRFRHTSTTRWAQAASSDKSIRRAIGHNSLEACGTYVKFHSSMVMRPMQKSGIESLRQRATGQPLILLQKIRPRASFNALFPTISIGCLQGLYERGSAALSHRLRRGTEPWECGGLPCLR
jgi:hypothetical protein